MPKIIIENLFNREINTATAEGASVFDAFKENGIDWMHACGTKGRCTTCKFTLQKGAENVSDLNKVEQNYKSLGMLRTNERLACQCQAFGDIIISVPEKGKMPHMKYSD